MATSVSVTQRPVIVSTAQLGDRFERRFLIARLKRIAEAAHRMNQPGRRRVLFDLLAQAQNIHVDGAIGDGAILPPNGVQQLFAAEDHARPAHQKFQQPELGGGQGEVLAVELHLAAAAVEFDAAGFEQPRGRGLRAELELDARDQFADEERLDDVVVRAQLKADDAVGFGSARGEKNNRRLRQFGIVADPFADIEPVGIGQHDIEQDQVGPNPPAKVEGAPPGLRPGEKKAFFFEVVLQQREEIGVVFDEDNSFCHGTFSVAGFTLQEG